MIKEKHLIPLPPYDEIQEKWLGDVVKIEEAYPKILDWIEVS